MLWAGVAGYACSQLSTFSPVIRENFPTLADCGGQHQVKENAKVCLIQDDQSTRNFQRLIFD